MSYRGLAVLVACGALATTTLADTLVLRSGRRIDGDRVDVRSGMTVYFEATGRLRWGPDRQHGPGGEGGSRNNPNRPIPGRPGGALIGRVGGSDPFYIGDERGPIRMRESGRLSLGVNDDYLEDNSGSWRVTIYY